MKLQPFLIGVGLFLVAQTGAWFQTNGQFISTWMKDHPIMVSAIMGVPVGLCYIYGTSNLVEAFNGQLWPSRLLGFATGITTFTFLTYGFLKEGINLKTAIILGLATIIVMLQVFWKYENE